MKKGTLGKVAKILLVAGGLNWGLLPLLKINIVQWLATSINVPILETIVYIAVGLSAVWQVFNWKK